MFNCEKYVEISDFLEKSMKNTKIIAVSKNQPIEDIEKAIDCGVKIFGENRVQEAQKKFENILKQKNSIELHLTGPLQTNKVKQALNIFDTFHTLDRLKLLKELAKYPDLLKTKTFFIQVNTGKEETKSGVYPEDINEFYEMCIDHGIKNIRGFMCIPPINDSPRKHFDILKNISNRFISKELSIGMSSDYLEALDYNPSYIRLGTLFFGKRL